MAMNTPYLSMDTSAQSNINSPYVLTGYTDLSNISSAGTIWVNDLVIQGSLTTSGAIIFSSTLSVGGAVNLDSTVSIGGATTITGATEVVSTFLADSVGTITGGLSIGGGTLVKKFATATVSIATISCAANASTETTMALNGVAANDVVLIAPPSALSTNIDVTGYVSSASVVTIRFLNGSASVVTVTKGGTYRASAFIY
jgi:hypothetical protein